MLVTFSKPYIKQKYTGKQECICYTSAVIVLHTVICVYTLFTSNSVESFQFTDHNHTTRSVLNILLIISYENLFLQTTGPTFVMTRNDKSQLREEKTIKRKKQEETNSKITMEEISDRVGDCSFITARFGLIFHVAFNFIQITTELLQ